MKYSYALSAAALAVGANAGGAPYGLKPSAATPAGYITDSNQKFMVSIVLPSGTTGNQFPAPIECSANALVFTIKNGELYDSAGRIADIVANRQFQFDGPPAQAGAIYDAGFSIAPNTSLAIGDTTVWYQCLSGGFYNIYDQSIAPYCKEVRQNVIPCYDAGSAPSTLSTSGAAIASQQPDGQPTASSAAPVVTQQTDGQPNGQSAVTTAPVMTSTPVVVSQISDGQPQASAASNATITSAQPSMPIATGAASVFGAGAVVAMGAVAALFL